ncbi:hypothetical protein SAMN04487917_101392 [Arthrobacter sp. yr096]|uniref:hypothetical protein n=1 Tax=Arthrobacter sp. yr096 TaxID=1761750 RepID=UPI0008D21A55|nr:hypothetical protein [Arthrobacter sp. yr096]SEI45679.1 hypothetical protein SAMN04487917_101392 [Arthrobacter sp. yr096]
MIINGFFVVAVALVCVLGSIEFGRARQHDARLQPAEPIDYDAIEEESQTRYEDDADAWRKGER